MSNNENLVLDFKRTIPAPFDAIPRQNRSSTPTYKTVSMHSNSTASTLVKSIVKMLLQSFAQKAGNERGGVGTVTTNGKVLCVAEYKSSINDDFHVVVYNPDKGNVMASVYDALTGNIKQYKCNAGNRDGSAILLAMLPKFMEDKEFSDNYEILYQDYLNGWSDLKTYSASAPNSSAAAMYIVSDNIYRRIKESSLTCYTPLELDGSGNIARVSSQAISQGIYEPDNVLLGGFEILSTKSNSSGGSGVKTANVKHEDFIGKYKFSNRQLTAKEASLVPIIPEHIIITQEAEEICKLAQGSTSKPTAMRNFLMRGGAGSGKTWTAKQVAAGLGLPEVIVTCHPDMSMDELIGQMLPKTQPGHEDEAKALQDMGGPTPENVAKLLNLPDYDTIEFEPEVAYKQMTGVEKDDATPQDCMQLYTDLVSKKQREVYVTYETEEEIVVPVKSDFANILDMGGFTKENTAKYLGFPDEKEMRADPAEAYKKITGSEYVDEGNGDLSFELCEKVYYETLVEKMEQIVLESAAPKYRKKKVKSQAMQYEFVEGVLLQAVKYGWVCEVQEPTVISRPGVLAGLNSILEQEGSITLPDGRVIVRHPDAVIVVTTNISYEGCRALNQSVLDRMNVVYDVETPTLHIMVARAMSVTGETDEPLVNRMAQVVSDVAQYCKEHCITSGITGMRVLIDWVTANQILGNPYRAALSTLIAKASEDEEERVAIQTTCLDPMISPTGPVSFN